MMEGTLEWREDAGRLRDDAEGMIRGWKVLRDQERVLGRVLEHWEGCWNTGKGAGTLGRVLQC